MEWSGLILVPRFDRKDQHGVQSLAFQSPVKYVRLVRRNLKGRTRWFAQLVCSGTPKWKEVHVLGNEKVGLDLNPDGTIRAGKKEWVVTMGYLRLRAKVGEIERKKAAYRKTEHGRLVHRILKTGRELHAEKLSCRAFQKNFGKSVNNRAPGLFMNLLRRKAESAGGRVLEFSTRTTRLSRVCHGCGVLVKNPLSLRWHAVREAVERIKQMAIGTVRPASFGFYPESEPFLPEVRLWKGKIRDVVAERRGPGRPFPIT